MKIGSRVLNTLVKNGVSFQDQCRLLRLLSNDFGLNEYKFKCWIAELPLCRCGKYDAPSHFIFSCKEIERKGFIDILKENIDRSLIALINCNDDRAIMALIFFLKKTQLYSTLVITKALILSIR